MTHQPILPLGGRPASGDEVAPESPRHGFQGNRGASPSRPRVPLSLTIAVSREAGARGSSIARRVGERLGWQVYAQDVLEYIAQEGDFRQQVVDNLPAEAGAWVEEQFRRLTTQEGAKLNAPLRQLIHMVLALGAQGEVVMIGRGTGFLLPPPSTLHVRLVAPLEDRIAYMAQWLRLTREEAADQVRVRDQRRNEYLEAHFRRRPTEPYHYDLLLNSSLLGEELCADLIVQAARAKLESLSGKR
jgi:cytidylate kinase